MNDTRIAILTGRLASEPQWRGRKGKTIWRSSIIVLDGDEAHTFPLIAVNPEPGAIDYDLQKDERVTVIGRLITVMPEAGQMYSRTQIEALRIWGGPAPIGLFDAIRQLVAATRNPRQEETP